MLIQEQIAAEKSEEKVGTVQRVIIDREEGDYFIGRTEADSPEVDCEVLVSNQQSAAGSQLKVGEFYDIKITGYEGVDLFGRL
jgi:ribosomal protein S12 methylthiotransferase